MSARKWLLALAILAAAIGAWLWYRNRRPVFVPTVQRPMPAPSGLAQIGQSATNAASAGVSNIIGRITNGVAETTSRLFAGYLASTSYGETAPDYSYPGGGAGSDFSAFEDI